MAGGSHGVGKEWTAALRLAPYLTWMLCVRCSPMLFVGAPSTRPSYQFLVALTLGVAATVLVSWGRRTERDAAVESSRFLRQWRMGCGCAAVGTLACLTPWCAGLPTAAIAGGVGLLVGVAYGTSLVGAMACCRARGVAFCARVLAIALACSLGALVMLCAWVTPRWLALVGVLPLVSGALVGRGTLNQEPVRGVYQGRVPWGRWGALLACVGFFAAFVIGMHPKTAHLPWLVDGVSYIGVLSSRSLVYLLVYGVLLALVAYGLGARSGAASRMPALVALVLAYAVMFFTLPFMKELGIAAGLNNALSLLFLTIAVGVLACLRWRDALRGAFFLALGALAAALVAALCMGPLFDVLPYQDEVFVALPFVVNLGVLVLAVTLGGWLLGTLPSQVASGSMGETPTNARVSGGSAVAPSCAELATRWGLTAREAQVFELIVQGRNEPYMSERLCISRATVKTHVNHIYKKAGVLSRQELLDRVHGDGDAE